MSELIKKVQFLYDAFSRGDVDAILGEMTSDVSWEFEAPPEISWSGIRRGPAEAAAFFSGIGREHGKPELEMTEFFEKPDAVAAFGRYRYTDNSTGQRVDTPVAHYFKFRDGKVARYINLVNSAAVLQAAAKQAAAAR